MDKVKVDKNELETAFEFVSFAPEFENQAFICRKTGTIYFVSDYMDYDDEEEEMPEDFDNENYISIPHKNDWDLGKNLVFEFAEKYLPNDYDDVEFIFSKPGAYSHWKRLLEKKNLLQKWYDYEQLAQHEAIFKFFEDEGIILVDS